MKTYKLHCGHLDYEVTSEAKKAIDGLMYWTHVKELESVSGNIHALNDANKSIADMMKACERLGVPNWVGNGAMQFARDNDLRKHYLSEFYEKSVYSESAMTEGQRYLRECRNILKSIGQEETKRLFSYSECEVEPEFLGFLENYKDISERVPKDFTIIDIGCYMAFQSDYYKEHERYIGVEPDVPLEYRLRQSNAVHYQQNAQQFVSEVLPKLIDDGLDLKKTFAVCSAVPDVEAQKLVADTFPYHRIAYPSEKTIDHLPENIKTKNKQTYDR